MAPAVMQRTPSGRHVRQVSRSLSSTFSTLKSRAVDMSDPPLVSVFALVLTKGSSLSARAASAISDTLQTSADARAATGPIQLSKRQNQILAIPTTYKGLNAGPAPGAVVGIMLGSIAGFIICLYLLLFAFQFTTDRPQIIEEEIITTTRRRSRLRPTSHHTQMSERPPRRETTIIEETRRPSQPPPAPDLDEVIVEEHEDDIVEVIEDPSSISSPSPPPKPSRRESRRSGYRTVDPAEFGGGRDSMKRVRRRD